MNKEQYVAQVTLLLDCLTVLKDQELFALKGGTAITIYILIGDSQLLQKVIIFCGKPSAEKRNESENQ